MDRTEFYQMILDANGNSTKLAQMAIEAQIFPVSDADYLTGMEFIDLVSHCEITAGIVRVGGYQ